jgi:hypothetical protein
MIEWVAQTGEDEWSNAGFIKPVEPPLHRPAGRSIGNLCASYSGDTIKGQITQFQELSRRLFQVFD